MTARTKRTALILLCCVSMAGIGFAGFQHYLDTVKLPAVPPRQVVENYFAALKRQDYAAAYACISLRHYTDSFNQFIDRVTMYSPEMELEITGESILENNAVVDVRVAVPLAFGPYRSDSSMELVRVKREWKIIHP